MGPQVLEDVPELIHQIQSRLPVTEAARTSTLSKSWLHAWSTIPTLRFHVPSCWEQETKQLKYLAYIDRTLIRYLHDNIPIKRFDLEVKVKCASLAEKWIQSVVTKSTCLKELFLAIKFDGKFDGASSFRLPEEILSGQNLTKIRVSAPGWRMRSSHNHPPIVNCVSLRELYLSGVCISQQLLDHILSSCRLLAKIELIYCSRKLKTIKVKNLHCLNELQIVTNEFRHCPIVEINNVPNLRLFSCNLNASPLLGISNVTQLSLGGPGLVTDYSSLDMIKSGFPFLESLTLNMTCWTLRNFHFVCAYSPIKRLSLMSCPDRLIGIHVNALKLLFFHLDGNTMPSLSFPISTTLEEIKLHVSLRPSSPLGASFFLKMREALELSSKCYVDIATLGPPVDLDLDDLKTMLRFPPATNVQTLSFETNKDACHSPFFDVLFEICHPKLVTAKLIPREVFEKKMTTTANWRRYLKNVQIRTAFHEKWETLTDKSFLDGLPPTFAEFKLEWC